MTTQIWHCQLSCIVPLVFSIGYGFAYPTINTMVIDRAHPGERGTAVGIFNMSYGIGINSSAIVLGLIVCDYGFFSMYLSTALFLVAGCVIFLPINTI